MRKILGVYDPPRPHWVGDGFLPRSVITPQAHGSHVSPFILLDYMAPLAFTPGDRPRGVGAHPHRGFETVTIAYQGEVEHRDSAGNSGLIGPGDVQWMTAASGVLHEEFHSRAFTAEGGVMEMAQLWVNLPAKDKARAPGYQSLASKDIPVAELPGNAGRLRIIAGEFQGLKGPAHTFTPMNVWDVRLAPGGMASLTLPEGHTLTVAVLNGTVEVNGAQIVRSEQTVVFDRHGGSVTLEANASAKLLLLSGAPIEEPMAAHGPFVMNTPAEINQAIRDFQTGKFGEMPDAKAKA